MATTYTLISSNVLGSDASSVTFSNITQTYNDLVLWFSAKQGGSVISVKLNINGDTTTAYSDWYLRNATSASQDTGSTFNVLYYANTNNNNNANAWGISEIYIPKYTAASPHQMMVHSGTVDSSYFNALMQASLYSVSSAITSITLAPNGGSNFLANSSFYLYGISNS